MQIIIWILGVILFFGLFLPMALAVLQGIGQLFLPKEHRDNQMSTPTLIITVIVTGIVAFVVGLSVYNTFIRNDDSKSDQTPLSSQMDQLAESQKKADESWAKLQERVETEKTFVDECTKDGASKAQCGCVYSSLSDRYTQAELYDIENEYRHTGRLPEALQETVQRCVKYNP